MRSNRRNQPNGFIHLLPLLLLAELSVTTFAIVREVGKRTQIADTRSQAAKPKDTKEETEAEARARRRANSEAEKKKTDADKDTSAGSRKGCTFWCGGCGTGFCGDSKAVEEDDKLRLTVSCEAQAWSKCGGSKCTNWCAGCGGFCGDGGTGGCNAQALKLCGQKPCYETGTCVTAAATPTPAPSCTQPQGTKLANGTYCCSGKISQKVCGTLTTTPTTTLAPSDSLPGNLAAFQNCVNSGTDATTCRNQIYGTTTTPSQPRPTGEVKISADSARYAGLACTYLPAAEQQACKTDVQARVTAAPTRAPSTLLADGETCGSGGRSCADCRSGSAYRTTRASRDVTVCGKPPSSRTTAATPTRTTSPAVPGVRQPARCGNPGQPSCDDVCEPGTYKAGFLGTASADATCVPKSTSRPATGFGSLDQEQTSASEVAQGAQGTQVAEGAEGTDVAEAGGEVAQAPPAAPQAVPTPTIAEGGLLCGDIYRRGECVRAGSNRWVRCIEEDGKNYPVLRDDPTCSPIVQYAVNVNGEQIVLPVQLGVEPPGYNDYIACQNNAINGIGCFTGETYGQCSSGPGGNTYTCICDANRGYRFPVPTKVNSPSECGKVPDAVAVALAQYQATQRPVAGLDVAIPDGKKNACGNRDEWESWVDAGYCRTCVIDDSGNGTIVAESLTLTTGTLTKDGRYVGGGESSFRVNTKTQCGVVATDKPGFGTFEVIYDPQYTQILPGPLTPDRPVCSAEGCVAGRIDNGKLVKIPVTATGEGSTYAFSCPSECAVIGPDSGSIVIPAPPGAPYAGSVMKCSASGGAVETYAGASATKPRSVTACASGICSAGECVAGRLVVDASSGTARLCGVGETCKTVDQFTGIQVTQTVTEVEKMAKQHMRRPTSGAIRQKNRNLKSPGQGRSKAILPKIRLINIKRHGTHTKLRIPEEPMMTFWRSSRKRWKSCYRRCKTWAWIRQRLPRSFSRDRLSQPTLWQVLRVQKRIRHGRVRCYFSTISLQAPHTGEINYLQIASMRIKSSTRTTT